MTTPPPPPRRPTPPAWRSVYLPAALGLGLIGISLLALIPLTQRDLGMVASIVFICLCQVPLLIGLFLVYLLMIAGNFYAYKANRATRRQLRRAHRATSALHSRVASAGESLSRRSIGWAERLAMLDPLFDIFDRPASKGTNDHEPEPPER